MNILIAEDDVVSCRMLEANLARWSYDVIVTADGIRAMQLLEGEHAPRIAILDWVMPGMDGIEICREVRKLLDRPYTYILLLTSKNLRGEIIEGLEAGADDYLVKPFDTHELRARLSAGRRIVDLQDQLIAAREALRVQATHDALTGLWNRTAILEILERELRRGQREQTNTGLLMADLDHFKNANDTFGHMAGDVLLKEAARRMLACLRPYDSCGRYGGEEFLVILPGCDAASAICLAERLRKCVSDFPMILPEGTVPLTISVGASATTDPEHHDGSHLLRTADAALYRAKRAGRDRVEVGGPADLAPQSLSRL